MRWRLPTDEPQVARLLAALAGLTLAACAALSADAARAHMRFVASFCGGAAADHCGWCVATVLLALAGLAAFAYAGRQVLQTTRAQPRA
jgi:hypothetical protein